MGMHIHVYMSGVVCLGYYVWNGYKVNDIVPIWKIYASNFQDDKDKCGLAALVTEMETFCSVSC